MRGWTETRARQRATAAVWLRRTSIDRVAWYRTVRMQTARKRAFRPEILSEQTEDFPGGQFRRAVGAKLVAQHRDTPSVRRVRQDGLDRAADSDAARSLDAEADAWSEVSDVRADLVLALVDAGRNHRRRLECPLRDEDRLVAAIEPVHPRVDCPRATWIAVAMQRSFGAHTYRCVVMCVNGDEPGTRRQAPRRSPEGWR